MKVKGGLQGMRKRKREDVAEKRGIRKSSRGGEFDLNTLYAYVEIA
jgi:hypothetical protein